MSRVDGILEFWFGAADDPGYGAPREAWFKKDPAFDAEVRKRFSLDYELAAGGGLDQLRSSPRSALALILVLDQFPRNMFRDNPRAYAADAKARDVARWAIEAKFDQALLPVERQFVYLPFEHSEELADQRRSVALLARLPDDPNTRHALDWARRHLEIIERFGRFPHRNAILGRETTAEEAAFLSGPGSSF